MNGLAPAGNRLAFGPFTNGCAKTKALRGGIAATMDPESYAAPPSTSGGSAAPLSFFSVAVSIFL
jgi:hypothetical protein